MPVEDPESGLDARILQEHRRRLRQALLEKKPEYLPVTDTCRPDNQGILTGDWCGRSTDATPAGFVAFVPAAGASSRYFAPLAALRRALEKGPGPDLQQALKELRENGAADMALPGPLRSLVEHPDEGSRLSQDACDRLLQAIDQPKALYPCTLEGSTFLGLKTAEHKAMGGLSGQIFVIPEGAEGRFRQVAELAPDPAGLEPPAALLEQGRKLLTLRFDARLEAVRDPATGKPSLVPAGHGTLIHLFADCLKRFPDAHSLLIRNIDNVMGLAPDVLRASRRFMENHHRVLQAVRLIRQGLAGRVEDASAAAADLAGACRPGRPLLHGEYIAGRDSRFADLWWLQTNLFGMDPALIDTLTGDSDDRAALQKLFSRPVNSLGQVPNSGKDVGGTPVTVRTKDGPVRVCLELPHASPEDLDHYLKNPARATHFNPVFVAAELTGDISTYEMSDSPFWILAKKDYRGQEVYYHETVLYELLGNNLMANALFPEVPRTVFNPHKSLGDSHGRQNSHWHLADSAGH